MVCFIKVEQKSRLFLPKGYKKGTCGKMHGEEKGQGRDGGVEVPERGKKKGGDR